jgi:hypothetical protein
MPAPAPRTWIDSTLRVLNAVVALGLLAVFAYCVTVVLSPNFSGSDKGGSSGWRVLPLGDVDHDGCADFAVSTNYDPLSERAQRAAWIVSGRAGRVLYVIEGFWRGPFELDDLDGDGVRELAFGDPRAWHGGQPAAGRVWVLSGDDAALLRDHHGWFAHQALGQHVELVGDVDGDGARDLLVSDDPALGEPANRRRAQDHVLSAADGRPLVSTPEPYRALNPFRPAQRGDFDGDGREEELVAIERKPRFIAGSVTTRDGRVLLGRAGLVPGMHRNDPPLSLGDVDDDGCDDFALVANSHTAQRGVPAHGMVSVHSGRDGRLVLRIDRTWLAEADAVGVRRVALH